VKGRILAGWAQKSPAPSKLLSLFLSLSLSLSPFGLP
jgi:hypothetical protein